MGRPIKFSDRDTPWYQRELKRKIRTRPPRERILIVCEGERTEPNYFMAIRRALPPNVVILRIAGTGMNTISLIEEALRLNNENAITDFPYDQIWAVFDKDDFPSDDFDNAIDKCRKHGVKPAYSNQAFELWYILHFCDRQTAMRRNEYKGKLSQYLGETYKKNDPDMYKKINTFGSESEAVRRASKLFCNALHPPSSANPCTTVFKLVEELNRFKQTGAD